MNQQMNNTQAVVNQHANTGVPAHIKQYAGVGKGDVSVDELSIPMLKKVEMMSKENADETIQATFGDIIDSITKENFGTSVNLVIIKSFVNYVIFDKKTQKKLGESDDGLTWKTGELAGQEVEKENAYKYKKYNFYVLLADSNSTVPIPHVVSIGGMSAKEGKRLYQIIAMNLAKDLPPFSNVYTFSTKKEQGDTGAYCSWQIKPGAYASENLMAVANEARKFVDANQQKMVAKDAPQTAGGDY